MKRTLAKAHKVAQIREHRCQRVRLDAQRSLQQCEDELLSASEVCALRKASRLSAENSLINEPADENARIWLIASLDRERAAREERAIAAAMREKALDAVETARNAHEKSIHRVDVFESQLKKMRLARLRMEEERALDEMMEPQR